jgi:hypothetical protein
MRPPAQHPQVQEFVTQVYGWLLMACVAVVGCVSLYALLLSRWLPLSGVPLLDAIAAGRCV